MESHLEAVGLTFGGFTVSKKCGRGRFSTVWNCSDISSDTQSDHAKTGSSEKTHAPLCSASNAPSAQPTAIKIFRRNGDSVNAFRYEIDNLTHLGKHPGVEKHVAKLIDSGVYYIKEPHAAVHCWYVMPLESQSLRDFIRTSIDVDETAPSVPVALSIMKSLFEALRFIHSAGLIHCDLKPENVLIAWGTSQSENIAVKLADFGASVLVEEKDNGGRGTIAYAAPEMLTDKTPIDTCADIWSAGAVMYEVITGERLINPYSLDFDHYELVPAESDDTDDEEINVAIVASLEDKPLLDKTVSTKSAAYAAAAKDDDYADDSSSDSARHDEHSARHDEHSANDSQSYSELDDDCSTRDSDAIADHIAEKNAMIIYEKLFGPAPQSIRSTFDFYDEQGKIEDAPYPIQRVEIVDLLKQRHSLHTIVSETKTHAIAAFIVNCMRYKPADRMTAESALKEMLTLS